MKLNLNREINGWLMVLVVLATAGITSWIMLRNRPNRNWNSPYYYSPQQVAWRFSPGITAANFCTDCHPVISTIPNTRATSTLPHDHRAICSNCHRLAGTQGAIPMAAGRQMSGITGVPVIRAGAVPPHNDRGVCTNCHTVLSGSGNPIPDISATASPPHENRGFCSNCHHLANQSRLDTNNGGRQAAMTMAPAEQVVAARATAPPATTATEGEWMGMEVAPITSLTRGQYNIPYDTRGLVVAEAEGPAATVGLRAGDVLLSINGISISNMTGFFQATRNGTLTQGVLEVLRKGQIMSLNVAQTTSPAPAAAAELPLNDPAGGLPAAMPAAWGDTLMSPGNGAAWGGGPGRGGGLGRCPVPVYPK